VTNTNNPVTHLCVSRRLIIENTAGAALGFSSTLWACAVQTADLVPFLFRFITILQLPPVRPTEASPRPSTGGRFQSAICPLDTPRLTFRAYWLRAPTSWTFKKGTFCTHVQNVQLLLCVLYLSRKKTATFVPYNINWLCFITETESVYCAVRTGSLSNAVCASSPKGLAQLRNV
jgi:hypothetical protein